MTTEILCSGLPQGVRREHLMELVERLAKELGLSHTTLAYLRALARTTRHTDWTEGGGSGPRSYVRQSDLAAEVGIEPRSASRIERLLERIGFIAVKRMDNNHRSGRPGAMGETGVFLAPLIERFGALEEMREAQLEAERRLKAAHARASVARAELRITLRDSELAETHPAFLEASEALLSAPSRLSRIQEIGTLEAIAEALSGSLRTFLSAVEAEMGAGDSVEVKAGKSDAGTSFESCAYDSEVMPHIQNTSNSNTVTCMKRTAVPADDPFNKGLETKPDAAGASVKANVAQTERPEESDVHADLDKSEAFSIPIASLMKAASEDFRLYVDARRADGWTTMADLIFAADMRRRELRIRDAAWSAAERLGYVDRAVAVLVLDVNQRHPETPVLNPGGALMGMIKKADQGELHLAASVIGILERAGGELAFETVGDQS